MTGLRTWEMTTNQLEQWTKKYKLMNTATNIAYSHDFDTIGCVTGDNYSWSHHTRDALLTNFSFIHWHGITLDYTFKKQLLGVEPFAGGKIPAKNLEILLPNNKPFIQNWDFIDTIPLKNIIDNPNLLQRIILLQEKSIDKLKSKIYELESKCLKLENVCTKIIL